jgi:hypothetical protein
MFRRIFFRQKCEGAIGYWYKGKQHFCFKKERIFVEKEGIDCGFEKDGNCKSVKEKHDCSKAEAGVSVFVLKCIYLNCFK